MDELVSGSHDNKENQCISKIEDQDFYRYIVSKVDSTSNSKELTLKLEDNEIFYLKLILNGLWIDTDVNTNDICNIINPLKFKSHWEINNQQGLFIVNPDILLSGTTISGSMFCQRKSILQHYFTDVAGKTKKSMLLGTLIHSIFQKCAKIENLNLNLIKKVAKSEIKQTNHLLAFYESEVTDDEIWNEIEIYFPTIVQWVVKNICR